MKTKIFSPRFGFFLLGLAVGYIIGNSKTSVSGIAVSSLLGLIGSVVSMIIEGKGDNERISKNLDTLGRIFCWFSLGMLFGVVCGSLSKGLSLNASSSSNEFLKFFRYLLPISHEVLP